MPRRAYAATSDGSCLRPSRLQPPSDPSRFFAPPAAMLPGAHSGGLRRGAAACTTAAPPDGPAAAAASTGDLPWPHGSGVPSSLTRGVVVREDVARPSCLSASPVWLCSDVARLSCDVGAPLRLSTRERERDSGWSWFEGKRGRVKGRKREREKGGKGGRGDGGKGDGEKRERAASERGKCECERIAATNASGGERVAATSTYPRQAHIGADVRLPIAGAERACTACPLQPLIQAVTSIALPQNPLPAVMSIAPARPSSRPVTRVSQHHCVPSAVGKALQKHLFLFHIVKVMYSLSRTFRNNPKLSLSSKCSTPPNGLTEESECGLRQSSTATGLSLMDLGELGVENDFARMASGRSDSSSAHALCVGWEEGGADVIMHLEPSLYAFLSPKGEKQVSRGLFCHLCMRLREPEAVTEEGAWRPPLPRRLQLRTVSIPPIGQWWDADGFNCKRLGEAFIVEDRQQLTTDQGPALYESWLHAAQPVPCPHPEPRITLRHTPTT
eukprot:365932-Chlamydomonas_euryale.AAC.3